MRVCSVLPYTYKFSRDVYFANAPYLTIFAILILRSPENFANGSLSMEDINT